MYSVSYNLINQDIIIFKCYQILTVHPRLHIQGSSNTPNELDTLTLECNVTANPPANITWLFRTTDGVKSVLATSRRDISHQYEANGSNGPVLQSTLVVRDVIQIDSGHYICEASSNTFTEAVSVNFSISVTGELTSNYCTIP